MLHTDIKAADTLTPVEAMKLSVLAACPEAKPEQAAALAREIVCQGGDLAAASFALQNDGCHDLYCLSLSYRAAVEGVES